MRKKLVCILDYGSGNVKSVFNIIQFLGYNVKISNAIEDIKNCTHLILPGVGSFGASMKKIINTLPIDVLENEVLRKIWARKTKVAWNSPKDRWLLHMSGWIVLWRFKN